MCASVKVENESKHNPPASAAENFISSCDFPKGLRVLLVDDDDASAEEIKSKLEGMEYTVSKFSTDADALANAMNGTDTFHVAIVEVNARNCKDRFRFLEMVRDLPTIMVSDVYCLNIMMKSIALGAVEFLQKPISDDKLRNIWQHVVHKAFRAEDNTLSRSLRPIKETISTMLRLPSETGSPDEGSQSRSDENDRFPAPSTPQLDQGGRLSKEEHNHGQNNCSSEQLEERQEVMVPGQSTPGSSEPKLVDIACDDEIEEVNHQETQTPLSSPEGEAAEDEHENSSTPNKDEMVVMKESVTSGSDFEYNGELECSPNYFTKKRSSPGHSSFSHNIRTSKKKMKVDWTPELHKRFVQAVQQLGVEQAIPSKILELMKVEGLTRHNVASHLQKYRLHQRHVLPKDKEQKWLHHRDYRASLIAKKPVPAFPPYQSNFGLSPTQAYPAWGHPSPYPMSSQMWGYHGYPTWQPSHGTWPWKSCYRMYADAWGCPVAPSQEPPQPPKKEEVIDEVVKEAISKPWLPLPLGLKPPSVDSVLTELRRQGIRHIPSHFSSGCRP